MFISAAAGVSVGRETSKRELDPFDRVQVDPELYLRFGFTFGR